MDPRACIGAHGGCGGGGSHARWEEAEAQSGESAPRGFMPAATAAAFNGFTVWALPLVCSPLAPRPLALVTL